MPSSDTENSIDGLNTFLNIDKDAPIGIFDSSCSDVSCVCVEPVAWRCRDGTSVVDSTTSAFEKISSSDVFPPMDEEYAIRATD